MFFLTSLLARRVVGTNLAGDAAIISVKATIIKRHQTPGLYCLTYFQGGRKFVDMADSLIKLHLAKQDAPSATIITTIDLDTPGQSCPDAQAKKGHDSDDAA